MTHEQIQETVVDEDVIAFGHKLAAWAGTISEAERVLLTDLIARAAATVEGDVQGHGVDLTRAAMVSLLSYLRPLFPGSSNPPPIDNVNRSP